MSEGVEPREPDQLEGVRPAEYQSAVIGHEAALTDLRGRLERGRLPGGVLLHGPRGIGKATLTFQIAREIFTATSDEEQAVSTERLGPCSPSTYDSRPAAVLSALPVPK